MSSYCKFSLNSTLIKIYKSKCNLKINAKWPRIREGVGWAKPTNFIRLILKIKWQSLGFYLTKEHSVVLSSWLIDLDWLIAWLHLLLPAHTDNARTGWWGRAGGGVVCLTCASNLQVQRPLKSEKAFTMSRPYRFVDGWECVDHTRTHFMHVGLMSTVNPNHLMGVAPVIIWTANKTVFQVPGLPVVKSFTRFTLFTGVVGIVFRGLSKKLLIFFIFFRGIYR